MDELATNPHGQPLVQLSNKIKELREKRQQRRQALERARSLNVSRDVVDNIIRDINSISDSLLENENQLLATKRQYDVFSGVEDNGDYSLEGIYANKTRNINNIIDTVDQYYKETTDKAEKSAETTVNTIAGARAGEAAVSNANANKYGLSIQGGQEQQNTNFLKTQEAVNTVKTAADANINNLNESKLQKELQLNQMNSTDVDNYLRPKPINELEERAAYFNKYGVYPVKPGTSTSTSTNTSKSYYKPPTIPKKITKETTNTQVTPDGVGESQAEKDRKLKLFYEGIRNMYTPQVLDYLP